MEIKDKIVLSGGGTGGSVTPLLRLQSELSKQFDFLFVGTYFGPEKIMAETAGLKYVAIASGKWRRYFSLKNLSDIFLIFLAFFQSLFLLLREKPKAVVSAGSFVAVPLSWAARLLGIAVIIHQQDVVSGLANKLMAGAARVISVTFAQSLKDYGAKAVLTGNLGPEPGDLTVSREEVLKKYDLEDPTRPLLIVLGGGTGSFFLNQLLDVVKTSLTGLANVIHVSGLSEREVAGDFKSASYLKFSFINHRDLLELLAIADLVVSRCGLGSLTELSFLGRPSILIPMPDSHQEYNALEFKKKEAAIVLDQKSLSADDLLRAVEKILSDQELRDKLSRNISTVIPKGNRALADLVIKTVKKQYEA